MLAVKCPAPAQRPGTQNRPVQGAEWICQLVEYGLVGPSFVLPTPIRELRDLAGYRKAQIDERDREAQRLDKVLQDAGIKLSSVASDILGKSGQDMLMALISGTQDPQVLDELARGRLRAKIPLLRRALEGPPGQPSHPGRETDPHGIPVARLDYSLSDSDKANMAYSTKPITNILHAADT